MPSQGMLFYYMVVPFHGLLNNKKLFHYLQPRASVWQPPMQPKKPSGFALSFHNSLKSTLSQSLFSDNQSAIALTKDHQYHAHTKHIDICFHFIHWIVKNGSLWLIYCPTNEIVADTLTKALPSPKVKHFAAELGLVSIWGGVLEFWHTNATWASIATCRHSICMYLLWIVYLLSTKMMVHSTPPHIYFPNSNALLSLLFYCLILIY